MVDKKVCVILIIAGLFCLTSIIMSLYSISTANWSIDGLYHVGLFQTCANSQCRKNEYGDTNSELNSPPIFSKRLYNAGPLSIVGVFLQLIVCILCFLTSFLYFLPKPSITYYIIPLLIFLAFIFQLSTICEASYGIHLNGPNSILFETALVLEVVVIILTIIGADRIRETVDILYV